MIISKDRKHVLLGVPKNGSQTAASVLAPWGDFLNEQNKITHSTIFGGGVSRIKYLYPETDVDQITYYGFWRNPVERFISAVNYMKRSMRLVKLGVSAFDPNDVPLQFRDRQQLLSEIEYSLLPTRVKTIIENTTLTEILMRRELYGEMKYSYLFAPQSNYFETNDPRNIVILDFANYENNIRMLVDIFGGNGSGVTVPVINAGFSSINLSPIVGENFYNLHRGIYHYDYTYENRLFA